MHVLAGNVLSAPHGRNSGQVASFSIAIVDVRSLTSLQRGQLFRERRDARRDR